MIHPAISVAQQRIADFEGDFTPTAIRTRDNIAAVVMDSEDARFVIIMESTDGAWKAPAIVIGSPPPAGPRAEHTPDYRPLQRLSRKRSAQLDADLEWPEYSWFAVTGLAAEDATEISIAVDGSEYREPIGDNGLAFAIARVHRDSEPEVYVHTRDGRRVLARH